MNEVIKVAIKMIEDEVVDCMASETEYTFRDLTDKMDMSYAQNVCDGPRANHFFGTFLDNLEHQGRIIRHQSHKGSRKTYSRKEA